MAAWLVTGGSGFLGRHVLRALELAPPGASEVLALGRSLPPRWPAGRFLRADLEDREGLAKAVAALAPAVVIHAAGRTPPAEPGEFLRGNTQATHNLLNALRLAKRPVRVVVVGSAAELGPVPVEALPVDEEYPCRPADAYGLSKWQATVDALASPPPVEAIVARVFNPIGPGLPTSQAFGRFAAALAAPGPDPLRLAVGGLDARRDFIDARDVAAALIALALRGRAGEVYHVGTGRSHRVGEGLDRLIRHSGRAVEVIPEDGVKGPADSRADIDKITAETGWAPRIGWDESLADLWEDARLGTMTAPRHVA